MSFPEGKIFWRGILARHTSWLVLLVLLTLLAVYSRAYSGIYDWADAVAYQAAGRALVERGTLMPPLMPYATFMGQEATIRELSHDSQYSPLYPSLAYQFLIGTLGKWRGDQSQVNGVLLGAFFSVLFSVALYVFSFAATRSRLLSFCLVVACLTHPVVMGVLGRPLTDISLSFFLFAALLPMSTGHSLLAGTIFGAGYMFREVGLFYLPALALLSPKSTSLRGYVQSLLAAGCGYALWLFVNQGLLVLLRVDSAAPASRSFYLDVFIKRLKLFGDMQQEILANFWSHVLFYANHSNPFGLSPPLILVMLPVFLLTTALGRRIILLGGVTLLLPCVFSMNKTSVDVRYALNAVPLFLVGIALAVNRLRFRIPLFIFFLITIYCLSPRQYLNTDALRALSSPKAAWAHFTAPMRAKTRFSKLLMPESTILTSYYYMDGMIFSRPNLISLPDYDTWRNSPGNERFDAITFTSRGFRRFIISGGLFAPSPASTWPIAENPLYLEDSWGVRFIRFKGFQDDLDGLRPNYVIYLKE